MDFCWMRNTNKLVISVILNIILLGFIIYPILTTNDDIVNNLEQENKTLLNSVDSLLSINDTLKKQNQMILVQIDKVENELLLNDTKINDLKNDKNKIPSFVDNLSVDGVTWELTRYLNKHTK